MNGDNPARFLEEAPQINRSIAIESKTLQIRKSKRRLEK